METRETKEGYQLLRQRDRRKKMIRFHVLMAENMMGGEIPGGLYCSPFR